MLTTSAIFQGADQNILQDATITADATPMATYDLETLGFLRPDFRVRFSTGTVTINFAHPGSPSERRLGHILVIPMHNLSGGSPGVLSLTNDAGLNVPIPIPGSLRNGLPKTIVVDLTTLEPDEAKLTPGMWSLVITGNPVPVTLGGAVAIYGPKTALIDHDFQWGYKIRGQGALLEASNAHLSTFTQDLMTSRRSIVLSTLTFDADAEALRGWFESMNGRARRGLLWLTPEEEDGFFGSWDTEYEDQILYPNPAGGNVHQISVSFTEWSKGVPLL